MLITARNVNVFFPIVFYCMGFEPAIEYERNETNEITLYAELDLYAVTYERKTGSRRLACVSETPVASLI